MTFGFPSLRHHPSCYRRRLYNVFNAHPVKGKRCLVVGSAPNAWVEGILLAFGAAHVTTSEYQVPQIPPESEYASRMKTIHHEELLANPVQFDMIVIFSSIEHDGMGRYHDPISPGGDLQQMRNLRDLLKPGGYLVVEVPVARSADPCANPLPGRRASPCYGKGLDIVRMCEGRTYGPVRYSAFVSGWILEGMYGMKGVVKVGKDPDAKIAALGGVNPKETFMEEHRQRMAGEKEEAGGVSVLRKPQ